MEFLPDCRAKTTRGRVFTADGVWVPFFCANCGKEGGKCPEANMTFMFWQCAPCFERYGAIAGTMVVPDQVFYEKLAQEQIASHGRTLTALELAKVKEDDSSSLARLLKEAA